MVHEETRSEVLARLRNVLDPCSCATGDPINVVDLGLVSEIEIDDGLVRITVVFTSPSCLYSPSICEEIERRVSRVPTVETVEVVQEKDDTWHPGMMDETEKRRRHEKFRRKMEAHGIEPFTGE